jgi:glycosyltransferase involved in cell wall biosynthesis
MPVYNAEEFVRRAVESAVDQEEVGEIILIDDAGPDKSLSICQRLEREFGKVRLFRHPDHKNHGAGASRNLGIERARYGLVAFLDADDYYLPNRFKRDGEILLADASVDGVYSAIGVHYESEEARQKFLAAGYGYQEFLTLTRPVPPEELPEVLLHCHSEVTGEFHTNAITVRKPLFDRSGLFNERLRLRQDIHLWLRMAAVGRLVPSSIDKAVAMRGVHLENRMTDGEEHRKYVDYWWRNLDNWFQSTPDVSKRASRAFNRAYCQYQIKHRSKREARKAFLGHVSKHPKLILQSMGFFDLNLFEVFGRNWLTLHLTSAKNRVVTAVHAPDTDSIH